MLKEDTLKPLGGQCPKCLKQKVQCTCHTMFKVGDWVRVPRTGLIIKLSENEVKYGEVILADSLYKEKDLELWQPQVGEYCWFWKVYKNELSYMFGKFYNHNFLGYIIDEDNNGSIFSSKLRCWDNIEPFTYDLPSFLKDKNYINN